MADRTTGVVRRFTISLRPTLAAIAFAFALPVLIGLGARWSATARIAELQAANTMLQIENASYREATGALSTQIASLQAAVDDIGTRATVDPDVDRAMRRLPERVRARAMGGGHEGSIAANVLSSAVTTSPDSPFGVLRDLLGTIEERLASVRSGVEKRQALASATPSLWPIAGWISSGFGTRPDPFTGERDFHPGLDISADHGRPVVAPADGVVVGAAFNGNYGNLITIDHGFGITTRYAHLSRYAVMNGQRVRRGDVIGYVGSTGRSTSPHLHYEVLVNGQLTDPMRLLAGR
ncbi:MAG TPA: M23 family metallopeptidase [Vicinamibacterales bacterium]|nr:M23 family metallopeptidase [Vicinamibacterales bacterium]